MSRLERQRRRRRHGGSPLKRALLLVLILVLSGTTLGVLAAIGWVVAVADSAPNINQLKPRNPGQVSEVFALNSKGQPVRLGFLRSTVLRSVVQSNQIPQQLNQATIAIEDRRFYQHGGVDYEAILRAGLRDVFGGSGDIQGGSTLTMQLVRNTYLPERYLKHRDLRYKIIEAKLAEQLERVHSKNWILTAYLNDVPYGTVGGQTAYGVGAASQMFFDKSVSKLDLPQIALLAGLPQAPSSYNPFLYPGDARARRNEVLQAMVTSHYITPDQAYSAEAQPLEVHPNNYYSVRQQPYVMDYVQQVLAQKLGAKTVDEGGLKIYTTINLDDQELAREAILKELNQPGDPAAAVVTVDPSDGHVLAMANSTTYTQSQFDYATQAERQTGSAFKLFVLMTMIHDYHGDPNTTYYDSRFLADGWLPGYPTYNVSTAEHSYQGRINITRATILSDNTVFAQLDADVGPKRVAATAHAMGITSPLQGTPAEGIGGLKVGVSPLQMADAYATIDNGGYHIDPTVISSVVYPGGRTVDFGDPPHVPVFTPAEAYTALQVLKGVVTEGTGTAANYGCPAAGKTGTTSYYTDAWFVGLTPKPLSTAVWVGYPNATTSMNDVNGLGAGFGGTLSAPIWHTYMSEIAQGYCGDWTAPSPAFQGKPFYGYYTHFALGGPSSTQYPTGTTPLYTPSGGATTTTTTPGVTTPGTTTTPGATTTPGTTTTPGVGTPGVTTPNQVPPPTTTPGTTPPPGFGGGQSGTGSGGSGTG
jgi:penicillin-binding protein 1A